MIIIGAGISGLLAGALNPGSTIYEAELKNKKPNHKALFRCRKPDISKMLGISFKEVTVHKTIWLDGKEVNPSPRIAHMYSKKVTGLITSRSIFDTDSVTRYIPPKDFIYQLKKRCYIEYNTIFDRTLKSIHCNEPIISTIPIFKTAEIFGLKLDGLCHCDPIYVNRIFIPKCNSHCTIYYPDSDFSAYKASITGDTLIIEGMKKLQYKDLSEIYKSLGIQFYDDPNQYKNHKQKFGKITPIDNKIRQNVITDLTLKFGVYSLGRFATWRPKVMLDDVLNDIFVIRRLIEEGNYGSIKYK